MVKQRNTHMHRPGRFVRAPLAFAVTLASLAQGTAAAETAESSSGPIEEVVVQGRLLNSAEQLVGERLDDESVSNLIGSEMMSRIGDSTVAAALQRVPGLTLVNDKFVYVRGLGERYSSTTLNGARVPSVDLTRSVIPLDIFPTHVVESVRVQKSYSPDRAASFGGGGIDIRTRGLPDGLVFGVEAGSALNTGTTGEVITYAGGGDDSFGVDDGTRALPGDLRREIQRFQGDIGVQNIRRVLRARGNPGASTDDAQQVNRQLATLLNRDLTVKETDADPDLDLKGYAGNSFFVGNDLEIGFLASGAYESGWRETERLARSVNFPEERTDDRRESTFSVAVTGNASAGLRYADEHEVVATSLFLRNTDDETAVSTFFNENRQRSSGNGFQNVRLKYEEREVLINQLRGSHRIGPATRELAEGLLGDLLPDGLLRRIPEDVELEWFHSDSNARTDIPNEVAVSLQGGTDEAGKIPEPQVVFSSEAASYRFTELDDEVLNQGWSLKVPFRIRDFDIELSGGYQHDRQARQYEQTEFSLGPLSVDELALLREPLGTVFSDDSILDPDNDFVLGRTGANSQSYVAATMTDGWFGNVDITWRDTLRIAGGLRWEQYRQAALGYDPYGFSVEQPVVTTDPETLRRSVFSRDDLFPAVSLTWMGDWLAETFQLRFGYSETVTRPDLREITEASYIDPLTDDLVFGNADVRPADVTNYDVRAEWFFSNSDNFSVSLFYKELENPIEFFETAASDTTIAREIVNAESAEVYGVELEALKQLDFLGGPFEPFFLQGNVTIQDSELVAGARADAPTNDERELTNAAPWVANLVLGFDSRDGRHSGTLSWNLFDDRLFVAGRNGAPDGFEQGRHSLDATWSWYPSEQVTLKAKAGNILDEPVVIERGGVETFREEIGRTLSASLQWDF
jgi:outer membrane receptor protein involved in Fe transport